MKICSFFNPAFSWVDQLAPLLGAGEVDKLNAKLRSLNVTGAQCHNVNSGSNLNVPKSITCYLQDSRRFGFPTPSCSR